MPIDQKEAFLELQRRGAFDGKDPSIINELAKRLNIEIPNNEPSKIESVARGVGQGVTMGFQDEASAVLEKGMIKAHNLFSSNKIPEPSYSEDRDQFRTQNKQAQEANPYSYGFGQILGGIGATVPFGAGAATLKGMTTLGAANAMGTSDKEGKGLVKDTAVGAGLGLGFGLVGKGISKIPSIFKDQAEKSGIKGLNLGKALDKLEVKGDQLKKAKDLARTMIDEGVINKTSTANTMEQKAFSLMKKSGKSLSDGYKLLDQVATEGITTPNKLVDTITTQIKNENPLMDDAIFNSIKEKVSDLASKVTGVTKDLGYGAEKKLRFNDVWDIAKQLDDITGKFSKNSSPAEESLREGLDFATSKIRGFLSQNAEKVSPEIASKLAPNADLYFKASLSQKGLGSLVRGPLKSSKLPAQGLFGAIWNRSLGSTPVRGAITGGLDMASKATAIPFGKQIVVPATKAAIIKSSDKGK